MIRITVCKFGEIDIELDYQNAPNTAANFAELARNHFYDGLTFHRIIKGFMIQGGDPRGNGTGGADYNIRGEFKLNGFDNKISHKRGVISMARAMDFDSASWENDARCILKTARSIGIPMLWEISCSGNGAHLWIFFSEDIQASKARKLAFCIIDKTRERYP